MKKKIVKKTKKPRLLKSEKNNFVKSMNQKIFAVTDVYFRFLRETNARALKYLQNREF